MEITTKAYRVNSINDIKEYNIKLSDSNEKGEIDQDKLAQIELVKQVLLYEYKKIVDILKGLEEKAVIKSIYIPKNKRIQKELDNLVKVKREIKKSLDKIKLF